MKNRVVLVAFFFLSVFCLFGQVRPFPQNVDYPYGYQAAGISADTVRAMYERWKSEYIRECNGMYRVRCTDDTSETRSEGMGYGMLLSAYFGEQGVFDSLFAFYKSKRTSTAYNLMAWQVTCDGITDQGSATDGDLDVAFALLVADDQWRGDYLEEADSILSILKEHYFVTCGSDIYTMKPGGWFGGCNLTDISYYTPAYFEAFGNQTDDDFWYDVIDGAYIILDNGTNSSTGLVRDWQTWDGSAVSGWDSTYSYDACRVPWRMALDYIWNGNADAEFWCSDISDFANGIGASNIVDGYFLDGTPSSGSNNSSAFVGGFAVGAMCHSQEMVDDFASHLLSRDGRPGEDRYFNFSLRCLYMLVLTGNFWQPDPNSSFIESNPLPEGISLAQNYPNPFHTTTTIEYSIAEASYVQLKVYDSSGRQIRTLVDKRIPAGRYAARLEASDLLPGVYFYQLKTGKNCIKKRMLLLK